MSLEQVARRVGLQKTSVQAIETGRSGPPLDRYEEIAAVVGAEVRVTVQTAGVADSRENLAVASRHLDDARLALLVRVAQTMPDVDYSMLRGAVEGLEVWARASRAARALG